MAATEERVAPDLYSVSLALEPLKETGAVAGHDYQAYAALLNLLRASHPSLAESLHDLDGPKPLTVSGLQGGLGRARNAVATVAGGSYRLRLTFLRADVFAQFLDGALKWGDRAVELGPALFRLARIDTIESDAPETCFNRYKGIIEGAAAERHIELEFLSPTAFRSGGKRNVVFPEPQLVFGSYMNRWQTYSPAKLDEAVSAWFDKVMVARYSLETRILDFGSYQEVGFVGTCRFEMDKSTPEIAIAALNALADFAFFCGTGAKTTMGMGQTRRLNHDRALSGKTGRYAGEKGDDPRKGIGV